PARGAGAPGLPDPGYLCEPTSFPAACCLLPAARSIPFAQLREQAHAEARRRLLDERPLVAADAVHARDIDMTPWRALRHEVREERRALDGVRLAHRRAVVQVRDRALHHVAV